MKSSSKMTDGCSAIKKGFFWSSAIVDAKETKYSIGGDPQKLNSRADSDVASSNREEKMMEATLKNPVGIVSELREGQYMQRTMGFQSTPRWIVTWKIEPFAALNRKKIGLHTIEEQRY